MPPSQPSDVHQLSSEGGGSGGWGSEAGGQSAASSMEGDGAPAPGNGDGASASASEEDVFSEVSPEQMEWLESMQPGRDGSKQVKRAEHEPWEMPDLSEEQRGELSRYLMGKLRNYCKHPGISQEAVSDDLLLEKGPDTGRPQWLRRALPHSFKSMLNALYQLRAIEEQFTFDYKMCPCGFLYR